MNLNPRKEFLQPIRTTERAKKLGRLGGIRSGQVRRKKAKYLNFCRAFLNASFYVDTLSDAEFNNSIKEYSKEEQEKIRFFLKPTEKDYKKMQKYAK